MAPLALTFASPGVLVALLAIPLVIAAYVLAQRRRRRYVVRFTAVPVLAGVVAAGQVSRWRRHLPAALLLAALAALLFALAKPQTTVAVPVEKASVMLVTDASGSMRADDVSPSRLAAAQQAGRDFLGKVPKELQVGAVSFSDVTQAVSPPSTDREDVRSLIDGLVADGGTAAGDALQSALDALDDAGVGRAGRPPAAIILLSDGATTTGADPVEIAREAGKRKVPIYTVALGTPDGTVPGGFGGSIPVPPDPETLREISEASGGQAYTADDADQLSGVYERLGSRLGTKQEEREVTAAFAGGGLVLLLGAAFAGWRTTGRLP
jgi:Ca-activated chloride channel family protein